ncbi:MAG: flagellar assembly protein FliH [Gammaproteobacteria bacterium]|nr:flagellar assembly protein FliH [Gammaproteobacteria bacterium]
MIANKLIPSDSLSAYQRWEAPQVRVEEEQDKAVLPTAGQIEQIHRQAYEEGHAQGLQEGRAQGRIEGLAEVRLQAQRLEHIIGALSKPLEQLDEDVEKELVALAIAIARQIVRREVKADPGQIIAVVREAVSALPLGSRNIHLHLHPEDATLVKTALSLSGNDKQWRIVEDPVLTRGGCQVITDTSRIDVSLDHRVAAIAASLLGGERGNDNDDV